MRDCKEQYHTSDCVLLNYSIPGDSAEGTAGDSAVGMVYCYD